MYSIPGTSPDSRAGIKILLLCLLMESRTTSRDRFPEGVAALLAPEDRVKGYKEVFKLLASHHAALVPAFGIGLGHHLQFLESTVLVNVLLELSKKHVVVLPLHDGAICQESKAELVCSVMEHRALRVLGEGLPVTVKGLEPVRKPS
jgi:hypothetical protein